MFDAQAIFLVVDDFEPMRKVTVNQLRGIGAANILTAVNGAEALRILKGRHVDIVLSDWNMPVMSGLDLLQAMRGDDKLAAIPFIMITAEAERSQVKEAIASGVTDLLLKPYTPNRLASQIEKAFVHRAPRRPVRASTPATTEVAHSPSHEPTQEPARQSAVAPVERVAPELPQILIVDDAPDNLMLLSHIFKDSYRVRLAQNGAKALALCQSETPPDLVLLDVMMPDMDGFEVIQRMREHPTSENIPVIFVTALTSEEGRAKGLELGAVDYVTKPVDASTLTLRVKNFMRYVNVQRQLQASYDDMLEMSRLREQVEHMARHDIKGPLASIVGILQSVIQEKCEHAPELELVEQTVMQVLSMINLSAELLKIETGRFVLHPVALDVERLLRRIIESTRAIFAEKMLYITLESAESGAESADADRAPVQVLGEPTFCYSIFQNLLKNACEASPVGAKISVYLTVASDVQVQITNRGAVPLSIRERFFDKFVTHGKRDGTGLGTYSARLLTEAQHGSIDLEVSDAEDTTVVTVHLPKG